MPRFTAIAEVMNEAAMRSAALACFAFACSPAVEPPPPTPEPQCTLERLMAFDPGTPVLEREALPPMTQQLSKSEELLAEVPCLDGEGDLDCRRRAEREVRAAYPAQPTVDSRIDVAREHVRVRFEVDGVAREETHPSIEALRERLVELDKEGQRVVLQAAEAVAAPDAPRFAVVHARSVGNAQHSREILRVALRVAPAESVVAMFALQARAADARIVVRLMSAQDDGSIAVEIGCSRDGS